MKNRIVILIIVSLIVGCSNSNKTQSKSENQDLENPNNKNQKGNKIGKNYNLKMKCDLNILKGIWISNEDKKYEVIITNKLFIHHNEGAEDDTLTFELVDKNTGDRIEKFCNLVAKERNSDLTYSYSIEVDDNYLSLTYLERGNRLNFTRKK